MKRVLRPARLLRRARRSSGRPRSRPGSWSPVLLPAAGGRGGVAPAEPRPTARSWRRPPVTLRRLVLGLRARAPARPPPRPADRPLPPGRRHPRASSPSGSRRSPASAGSRSRSSGSARPSRRCSSSSHGDRVVGHPRHRQRGAHRAADLRPRRAHHGLAGLPHLAPRDAPRLAALHPHRHEAGLGLRLALAHGRGDLRHDPDRLRARPPPPLRARAARHGPGHRRHAGDRPRGVCFDRLLFAPVERFLHRRWGTGRME